MIEATPNDVIISVKILQVYVRHDADREALVHSMRSMHNEEKTKTVLVLEGENAFNAVKRKAFLCNINIICPSIATFVHNYYSKPSRLFFIGGVEISSSGGTTQGDPFGMAVYTIATISLILLILEITDNCPNGI